MKDASQQIMLWNSLSWLKVPRPHSAVDSDASNVGFGVQGPVLLTACNCANCILVLKCQDLSGFTKEMQ